MVLYELRKQVKRMGKVILVDLEKLNNSTGFRSIYGFSEEAVEQIRENNSTRELKNFEFFSDTLFVDFDDQPEAAKEMEIALKDYQWEMYDSGGRSVHFHIKIEPMLGKDVPILQRRYMKANFPKSDVSIYKSTGMYRLTGTFHTKNRGCKKHLLKINEGKILSIGKVELEEDKNRTNLSYDIDVDDPEFLEHQLNKKLHTNVVEGTIGRNNHVFMAACDCAKLGLDEEACYRLITTWNLKYCEPTLDSAGILATINSAYRSI